MTELVIDQVVSDLVMNIQIDKLLLISISFGTWQSNG